MADNQLTLGLVTMDTEAGGVLHDQNTAYNTERVYFSVSVQNMTTVESGLFGVEWYVDGQLQAGSTQQSIAAGATEWAQAWSLPLQDGEHHAVVRVIPENPDFVYSEAEMPFTATRNPHHAAMAEGAEIGHEDWKHSTLLVRIHDFMGNLMKSGECVVELIGTGGESQERGQVEEGVVNFGEVWVPNGHAMARVYVSREMGPHLSGNAEFTDVSHELILSFTQKHHVEPHSHKSAKSATDSHGSKAEIGFTFGIWSAGGEISAEHAESETEEDGVEYQIWLADDVLESRSDAVAHDR
jgi:hypothetical protein